MSSKKSARQHFDHIMKRQAKKVASALSGEEVEFEIWSNKVNQKQERLWREQDNRAYKNNYNYDKRS